jgi:DNA-binding NarL/FixJ family response regulator
MSRIRLLLVDDDLGYLTRLLQHFESDFGFEIVGQAQDGREALVQAEEKNPQVIVLDMKLPGLDGVEVVRRLRTRGSNVRVLAISNYDTDHFIYGVLDEGASGYLIKDESLDTITEGVRGVFYGDECWFSPRVRTKLSLRQARALPPKPAGVLPKLTPKEEQTLELLAKGFTNWKISRMMDITEHAVGNKLYLIYQKLGVGCRGEAIAWAYQYGYAKPSQLPADGSRTAAGPPASDSLEGELARLASLLETRRIPYLLAGDVAVPRSAGSLVGEGVALAVSHLSLSEIPELEVDGHGRDWTRVSLGAFRIDLLLPGEPVLAMLIAEHAASLSLAGSSLRCVSATGQILLKLSLLPRLYQEAHFSRVVQWESDIATLIFEHQPETGPLLEKLSSCISETDQELISQILQQIEKRINWFRSAQD